MAFPPFPPSQLHPVFNHIPIVLIPLAAFLATIGRTKDWAWKASGVVVILAALGALATVVTGLSWYDGVHRMLAGGGPATSARLATLSTHRMLGLAVGAGAFVAAGMHLWKRDALRTGAWGLAWLVFLWALTLLVLGAAWYGGSLVFERPAGVGNGSGLRPGGNGTASPTP